MPIARVPRIRMTLVYELNERSGRLTSPSIDDLVFDEDQLDDNAAQVMSRYRRRSVPTIATPGMTRTRAYLLSTSNLQIDLEVQLRRRFRKRECRAQSAPGARRPLARPIYNVRARAVLRYRFRIDREIWRFHSDQVWRFDGVIEDPRGMRSKRTEAAWTQFALLRDALDLAPCVDPGAGVSYGPEPYGRIVRTRLYPLTGS